MQTVAPSSVSMIVRFPVERRGRPSLELLRELAPSSQEVLAVVAAFGLRDPPSDTRARADADTERGIIGGARSAEAFWMLDQLANATIARAVALCWSARDASTAVAEARREFAQAQKTGIGWLERRRSRLEMLRTWAAGLVIEAHIAAEQAEGVARAVGFARQGEPWVPTSDNAESVAVLAAANRSSGYKATVRSHGSRRPPVVSAG